MAIKSATFDPSRRLDLYFRINRAGSKRFVFVDSDGADYDISGIDFQLFIKDHPGSRQNRISLTLGNGLSTPVYEDNFIDAEVTADQTIANEGEYYWELYLINTKKTWLSGKAFFHNGEFDGVNNNTETLTISDDLETIQITISDSGTSGSGGGIDSASIDTSGGTITLNFEEGVNRIFIGNASFAGSKTVAYSGDTNALKFEFLFQVTNLAAVLTLQSNSLVNAIAGIWDSTGKTWTPNDIGRHVLEGTYDGANWWIKIRGFYE